MPHGLYLFPPYLSDLLTAFFHFTQVLGLRYEKEDDAGCLEGGDLVYV
jgi:hypothetical protein